MNVAFPNKRFLCLSHKRIVRLLFCGVLLFLFSSGFSLFADEPTRLLRIPSAETERPVLHLTPSGQSAFDAPITPSPAAVFPLPRLEETPAPPLVEQDELEQVIREGKVLETEARWAEVLTYYETALRVYRNDLSLKERYLVARFHCDVGRRYHDTSYLNLIRSLTVVETLNFVEGVMARIEQYYADAPLWEQLFRHGIQNFCIALADSNFRAKVNLNASVESVNACLTSIQKTVDGWKIRDREDLKNGLLHIAEMVQKQLGLNPVVVMMEFTCGVANSLDPNTAYLTPNQLNEQLMSTSGNLMGVGMYLRSEQDSLLVLQVIPASPAEENGIKERDRILAIDGVSTSGRHNAADLLQGEEGTSVQLSILSEGFGQRPRDVQITRRRFEVPSVENVRMLNEKLGYVKLTSFHEKTCVELVKALNDLDRQGMKCLVLDMRQNPGGLLTTGIEVANMFIEQGAIVRTQGRDHGLDVPYMAKGNNTRRTPLIVLIDGESASATEIVAGAIRDHHRGIIIGKQSYGKGTIQQILPIPIGTAGIRSGIKLTVEKFYSPLGWPYSGVGVTPNIIVPDQEKKRITLARPLEGRLPFPKSVTSNLDDQFIKEAVKVSQNLVP